MKYVIIVIVVVVALGLIVFGVMKMRKGKQGNLGVSGGEHKDQFNPTTVIGGGPSIDQTAPTPFAQQPSAPEVPTVSSPFDQPTPASSPLPSLENQASSASGDISAPTNPTVATTPSAPPTAEVTSPTPPESGESSSPVSPSPETSINVTSPQEEPKESINENNTSSTV